MTDATVLHQAILDRLMKVIDPETGVDVVRMRLIEDLTVDGEGNVSYVFRPSSPLCPIAIPLSHAIQLAVAEVPGVVSLDVQITGFALSDDVTTWLKQALEAWEKEQKR
jgi:metal-sulfur cluster biosynthetic enzyme